MEDQFRPLLLNSTSLQDLGAWARQTACNHQEHPPTCHRNFQTNSVTQRPAGFTDELYQHQTVSLKATFLFMQLADEITILEAIISAPLKTVLYGFSGITLLYERERERFSRRVNIGGHPMGSISSTKSSLVTTPHKWWETSKSTSLN